MTKTILVIAKIKTGSEAAFESEIVATFKQVEQEPGCRGLSWGPTGKPGEYALVERYADDAAIAAHRASDHMKTHGPALGALFDGPPTMVTYTER